MSDNEQVPSSSQAQNQSQTVDTDAGEAREHDNDRGEVQMSSMPRCIITMENALSRLLEPEHEQSHGVNESITSLLSQSLLERMGLGNQTLMIRLGLPLRACPSPA